MTSRMFPRKHSQKKKSRFPAHDGPCNACGCKVFRRSPSGLIACARCFNGPGDLYATIPGDEAGCPDLPHVLVPRDTYEKEFSQKWKPQTVTIFGGKFLEFHCAGRPIWIAQSAINEDWVWEHPDHTYGGEDVARKK